MHYLSRRGENGTYENENCLYIYIYIYIYIFISQKINFIYLKKQYYMNRKISIKVSQGVLGINVHSNSENERKVAFLYVYILIH